MLFGGQAPKKPDAAEMLGVTASDDAVVVDDALVIEDDAIIVDEKLTEDGKAILNAAKQKPLWEGGEDRIKYEKSQLFSAFIAQDTINFDLFDNDYMSVYDVFNQTP